MDKKVSVIIPVYNASETLERCVESIVLGEFKDTNIILVEDCSNDASWEICKSLAERFTNVQCHQNEKNSGVSYTRNQGLYYADSEYVMFVDSDDWVSSKYISIMVKVADYNKGALVICGLHYLDRTANYRRKYLWNGEKNDISLVTWEQFFPLAEQFLLQQLWNKIFHRNVIEENNIRFDESQSMGEDFQFVLDYMQVAQIKKCMVVNQPLYYYIRANNVSLMSKFGLIENENEFKRYAKLKEICGSENPVIEMQYQKAMQTTKSNYVYQICRNVSVSNAEKIILIDRILQDGIAKKHFREQQKLILKESIVQILKDLKGFRKRIEGRLKRDKRDYIAKKACKQLKIQDFSIISQNCIGGVIYHDAGMQFLSPTVNLFFKGSDFVKFVQNLKYYMSLDLEMYWGDEYPIGILEDISIYFMHYNTCIEAKEAWERRKKRINWDKILVLATDQEGFDENVWKQWSEITYPKLLFTVTERPYDSIVFPQYKRYGCVPDLIPDREFYKQGILINFINNCKMQ